MTENIFIRRPGPKNEHDFRTPMPKRNKKGGDNSHRNVEQGFLLYLRGGSQTAPSSWMQGKGI